jgi:hypothetical protein
VEVISESRKRKLARHATRLVKEHGAEVAANILVSLVSGAAATLLERRKALEARSSAAEPAKGGKKSRKAGRNGKKVKKKDKHRKRDRDAAHA